jgi:hypothetical protein
LLIWDFGANARKQKNWAEVGQNGAMRNIECRMGFVGCLPYEAKQITAILKAVNALDKRINWLE